MDVKDRGGFTSFEQIMLQHASPLKLACDGADVLLGTRLLCRRRRRLALGMGMGSILSGSLLGNAAVWRRDPHQLAATALGAWMLGQAEPANLALRTTGFTVVLISIWHRSWLTGAGGLTLIAAGRVLGEHRRRRTADVHILVDLFETLVEKGASLIVAEHDRDVITRSDWVIDLGPDAGHGGGHVVSTGTPTQLVDAETHTGRALCATHT